MEQNIIPNQVESESTSVVKYADTIKIVSKDDYDMAFNYLKGVKALIKTIKDHFKPHKDRAKAVHTALCDDEKNKLQPLLSAEQKISRIMGEWKSEQERQARELQQRLIAEAREKEDKKRQKLLERAEKAEGSGKEAKAEELRQQAEDVAVFTPIVEASVERNAGEIRKTYYSFEIVDEMAIPREYLIPDTKAIGALVRAKKEQAEKMIPGIKVIATDKVTARV